MTLQDDVIGYVRRANDDIIQPRLANAWTQVEPHYEVFKKVAIAFIITCNVCCISLCISAFLFGTIYFYHMPTVYHTFPMHFHYNRSCMQQHKLVEGGARDRYLGEAYTKSCYPVATIHLGSPRKPKLLKEGQMYSVVIKLELPETPGNLQMGMFMVKMEVNGRSPTLEQEVGQYRWSKRHVVVETSFVASIPMSMRYKSTLMRFIHTIAFWPLLMFDFKHESQVLDEVIFDNFLLQQNLNWTASIYIEHPSIDVYSAHLDVVAKFTGIQYLLYRWPIVSFFLGTAAFFPPVVFSVVILFYFCLWRPYFSTHAGTPERPATRRRRPRDAADPPAAANDQEEVHPTMNEFPVTIETMNRSNDEIVNSSRRSSTSSSSIEMIGQSNPATSIGTSSSFVLPSLTTEVGINPDDVTSEGQLEDDFSRNSANMRRRQVQ